MIRAATCAGVMLWWLSLSAPVRADEVVPTTSASEPTATAGGETAMREVPPPPAALEARPVLCPVDLELHDGQCMRRGTRYVLGTDWVGVGGGLAIFGAFYLVQVISTAVSTAQGQNDVRTLGYFAPRLAEYERWGYVPLLGPWAKIALAPPHVDDAGATLFVIEGLFELAGVAMAIVSLVTHVEDVWDEPTRPAVRVVPTPGGVAALGWF